MSGAAMEADGGARPSKARRIEAGAGTVSSASNTRMKTDQSKTAPRGPQPERTEEGEEEEEDPLVNAFNAVQELQKKIEAIDSEESAEVIEVVAKYNTVRAPVFESRNKLLAEIPEFWVTVFLNHEMLKAAMLDEDVAALKHCEGLLVSYQNDQSSRTSGHTVTLTFGGGNPYFENTELSKTFTANFADDEVHRVGTPIRWKPGMNFASRQEGANGRKRARDDGQTSFFVWFEADNGDWDDTIGDVIKDQLWPNPLSYYEGEMVFVEGDDEGAGEEAGGGEGDFDEGDMDDLVGGLEGALDTPAADGDDEQALLGMDNADDSAGTDTGPGGDGSGDHGSGSGSGLTATEGTMTAAGAGDAEADLMQDVDSILAESAEAVEPDGAAFAEAAPTDTTETTAAAAAAASSKEEDDELILNQLIDASS